MLLGPVPHRVVRKVANRQRRAVTAGENGVLIHRDDDGGFAIGLIGGDGMRDSNAAPVQIHHVVRENSKVEGDRDRDTAGGPLRIDTIVNDVLGELRLMQFGMAWQMRFLVAPPQPVELHQHPQPS